MPDVEIETPHPRTLRIKFREEHSKRWGQPQFVHGLECMWLVADAPTEKVLNLLHSSFATRNPLELTFEEDERPEQRGEVSGEKQ